MNKKVPLIKRIFDLAIVICAMPFWIPVMMICGICVRINMGKPMLFTQRRPGINGTIFLMYKFRTMTNERDSEGNLLPDEKRLTRFGKFLRTSSLDELPELFNVLRGEMSLVGPRPLLVQYIDRYTPEQMRRHEALPGMTGLAQISGRNAISWEDKFKLDVQYVDNYSVWLDIKILFLTVIKVLKREGISADGQATAEEFMGSKPKD